MRQPLHLPPPISTSDDSQPPNVESNDQQLNYLNHQSIKELFKCFVLLHNKPNSGCQSLSTLKSLTHLFSTHSKQEFISAATNFLVPNSKQTKEEIAQELWKVLNDPQLRIVDSSNQVLPVVTNQENNQSNNRLIRMPQYRPYFEISNTTPQVKSFSSSAVVNTKQIVKGDKKHNPNELIPRYNDHNSRYHYADRINSVHVHQESYRNNSRLNNRNEVIEEVKSKESSVYLYDLKLLKERQYNFQKLDDQCVWVGRASQNDLDRCGISNRQIRKINFNDINDEIKQLYLENNCTFMDPKDLKFYNHVLRVIYGSGTPKENLQPLEKLSEREAEIILIPEIFEIVLSYLDLYHRRNFVFLNHEFHKIMTQTLDKKKPLFSIPELALVIRRYRIGDEEINPINLEEQEFEVFSNLEPQLKKRKY